MIIASGKVLVYNKTRLPIVPIDKKTYTHEDIAMVKSRPEPHPLQRVK